MSRERTKAKPGVRRWKYTLGIGLLHNREEVVEYTPEDLDGMTEEEVQKFIEADWQQWCNNYLDGGQTEITDD